MYGPVRDGEAWIRSKIHELYRLYAENKVVHLGGLGTWHAWRKRGFPEKLCVDRTWGRGGPRLILTDHVAIDARTLLNGQRILLTLKSRPACHTFSECAGRVHLSLMGKLDVGIHKSQLYCWVFGFETKPVVRYCVKGVKDQQFGHHG